MALINTTSTIDNSVYLKARLDKNLVGSNFYIDNLQQKRNYDWQFRYNLVDIEEELDKQIEYTKEEPVYTPIDVVIRRVKSEKGKDLGTDWAEISFREFTHPNELGMRYRFHKEFEDMNKMSEYDKHFNTSIWITINKSPFDAGNSCIIRRCNASLALVGSPTREFTNAEEIHYEPVILDNDLKYINVYYNMTVPVPQAEWYVTVQNNYFSNCIKLNDRFIIGGTDQEVRENNTTFKVKAIVKASSETTFLPQGDNGIEKIPLIILGLDKDMIQEEDNLYTRVANAGPVYKVPKIVTPPIPIEQEPGEEPIYTIQIDDKYDNKILKGDTLSQVARVYKNGVEVDGANITFDYKLDGIIPSYWEKYFEFWTDTVNPDKFYIKNKKECRNCKLYIDAKYNYIDSNGDSIDIVQPFDFELAGFY